MAMRLLIICGWCLVTSLTFQKGFDATWYSLDGNYTKSGEIFDSNRMTGASNHFKLGTKLKVINIENGKSVIVKINDTGSFKTKTIDLSKKAFEKIANLKQGRIKIFVKRIK